MERASCGGTVTSPGSLVRRMVKNDEPDEFPDSKKKKASSYGRYYLGHWCSLSRICDMSDSAGIWTFYFSENGKPPASASASASVEVLLSFIVETYVTLAREASDGKFQKQAATIKPTPIVEPMKEDPDAGWPSFTTPVSETRHVRPTTPLSETRHVRTTTSASEARSPNVTEGYSQHKLQKSKSATLKDPSLSSKYRSSKRQDSTELYGSSETSPAPPPYGQFSSKSQKERTRYRQRDRSGEVRSGEVVFKASGSEPKPAELKPGEYSDGKFDGYIRNKYGSDSLFNF
ncbi:hypothetical protein GIB67_016690 [Kingdonia uniflora]|uniref:Uncharacterized protein n=1 Tax=Kingdonia uniflora TaxID=39325 RepID=A0A7J7MEB5_9MAGN|nr:hypothetical protein GIB67_016690 [Kingdonia uniflora]